MCRLNSFWVLFDTRSDEQMIWGGMVWKLRVVRWKEHRINCKEKKRIGLGWVCRTGLLDRGCQNCLPRPLARLRDLISRRKEIRKEKAEAKFGQIEMIWNKLQIIDKSPYRTDDEKLISFFLKKISKWRAARHREIVTFRSASAGGLNTEVVRWDAGWYTPLTVPSIQPTQPSPS